MLRTDLDNPAAMKLMREVFAAVMTEVSFETGQRQVYTAKSNAARGLPHQPQAHLGGALTNRARAGEFVAANEENHERVMRSKAVVIDDDLHHADEALIKQQDTVQQRFEPIVNKQSGEIVRIDKYVRHWPQHLCYEGGRWTLNQEAPPSMRDLVAAWGNDQTVQSALERVSKAAPADQSTVAVTEKNRTAWQHARQLREQAMEAWDEAERFDFSDVPRPGRQVARPGADRTNNPPAHMAGLARSIQRIRGPALGD